MNIDYDLFHKINIIGGEICLQGNADTKTLKQLSKLGWKVQQKSLDTEIYYFYAPDYFEGYENKFRGKVFMMAMLTKINLDESILSKDISKFKYI